MRHTNPPSLDSAPLLLTGTNDNKAKNLKACTGECDNDAQCSYGLKCFQRTHGEPIPGCWGKGGGPGWDYCYDPTRTSLLFVVVVVVVVRVKRFV